MGSLFSVAFRVLRASRGVSGRDRRCPLPTMRYFLTSPVAVATTCFTVSPSSS
jgi:hypothetical protein